MMHHLGGHSVGPILTSFNRMLAGAQALAARGIRGSRDAALRWRRPAAGLLLCTTLVAAILAGVGCYHIYLDRTNLPDLESFVRFDFPTIGHIYDTNGQPLLEMTTEYRWITKYEDIPPVVRGAGKRLAAFLVDDEAGGQKPLTPLTFLRNFFDELRRRAPAGK